MEKLKQHWGINSNFQFFVILIVFAINGSLAAALTKPVTGLLGIAKEETNPFLYWPISILIITVIHQFTLVVIGSLFGQKVFFLNMVKKIIQRFGRLRLFS